MSKSIESETLLQLSIVPPSMSEADMIASPFSSRLTEISWVITFGPTLSWILTIEIAVDWFPLESVTVRVTTLSPILEQSKDVISILIDSIPQLSVDPLLMSDSVIETWPFSSRLITRSCEIAIGSILSTIVTVAVSDETLPLASVAVNVTTLSPILEQSKESISIDKSILESQLSTDPLSISEANIVDTPFSSSDIVISCVVTTGAVVSVTVIVCVNVVTLPLSSVAVQTLVIDVDVVVSA